MAGMSRQWKLLILIMNLHLGSAVIYRLNSSEYEKMPPVFHTDPYYKCMQEPGAVYCVTELILVSDTPNKLLETIREYSEHTTTHFNHSLNRHGICLNSCVYAQNATWDRMYTLEACLNDTYWRKYGLKTKLQEYVRCSDDRNDSNFEAADIIFLVVLAVILLLNIVGSYYKVRSPTRKGLGIRLLQLFAIHRNWKKLMAPSADGPEPRLKNLTGIASAKVITTALVITAHTLITVMFYIDNPEVVEDYYTYNVAHLFLSGTIIVQTFFVITGFLLTYNLLLFSENNEVGWSMLPKGIFLRWIRLTPAYALLIFFTTTCLRFLGAGPAWDMAVIDEVNDCRKYWWQYLIYTNNYNDVSQCFLHAWWPQIKQSLYYGNQITDRILRYLAADSQLYCLGLAIFIACRSSTSRKAVLSLLLLLGVVIPPLQTYFQDLDGVLVVSPEQVIKFFRNNENYNQLYKKPHTNIFPYAIGLTAGYLTYHLQNINFNVHKYKKYGFLTICLIPVGLFVVWTGSVFYRDAPRPSMLVRIAYAAFMKPIYSTLMFLGLLILLFKHINLVNFLLESQVWTVLGRLSYSAYLVHVTILRIMMGMRTVESHVTVLYLTQQSLFLVFVSYAAAVPLWLLVEQPFGQMVKVLLT